MIVPATLGSVVIVVFVIVIDFCLGLAFRLLILIMNTHEMRKCNTIEEVIYNEYHNAPHYV